MISPANQQRLAILFFVLASLPAAAYVGYLFGWLCGSSMTPVVAVIAPLIIGLLAGMGVAPGAIASASPVSILDSIPAFLNLGERDRSKIKSELSIAPNYWRLCWTAVLLYAFSSCCYFGLRVGGDGRTDPFPSMGDAMSHWGRVEDMDTRLAIYQIRWRMQKAGKGGNEFWNFAYEVIDPIIGSEMKPAEQRSKLAEWMNKLPE
jgi:hypothetical protein